MSSRLCEATDDKSRLITRVSMRGKKVKQERERLRSTL